MLVFRGVYHVQYENTSVTTHEVGSLNLQTTISGELDTHPGPIKNNISDPKEKSNIFQKSTFTTLWIN